MIAINIPEKDRVAAKLRGNCPEEILFRIIGDLRVVMGKSSPGTVFFVGREGRVVMYIRMDGFVWVNYQDFFMDIMFYFMENHGEQVQHPSMEVNYRSMTVRFIRESIAKYFLGSGEMSWLKPGCADKIWISFQRGW